MGFATALSGLKAASTNLQVTGNNIANSQTTGFKESRAEFADVYASSLGGVAKTQPGSGVKVVTVAQQFSQGNIEGTDNSLDMAISGNGFFTLATHVNLPDPNNPLAAVNPSVPDSYTRNGSFQLDSSGNVVNGQGKYLLAFAANGTTAAQGFSVGVFRPLTLDTSQGLPQTTTNIAMKLNINGAASLPSASVFAPTNPLSYNNTTSITTYDTQGNAHIASTYYVKTPVANAWDMYLFLDGFGITTGGPAVPPALAPPSTVVGAVVNQPGLPVPMTFTASGLLSEVGLIAAKNVATVAVNAAVTAATDVAAAQAAAVAANVALGANAVLNATALSTAQTALASVTAFAAAASVANSTRNTGPFPTATTDAVTAKNAAAAALVSATAAVTAAAALVSAPVAGQAAAAVATLAAANVTNAANPAVGSVLTAQNLFTNVYYPAVVNAAIGATTASKVDFGNINLALINPSASVNPMAFAVDFFGSTQFATPFSVNALQQDGLPAGNLTGIDVDNHGVVFARYSNGGSKALGQVAVARFQSNQSLAKLGDTSWAQTSTSGQPIYGAAGDNNFGTIQSSALENSNTDLSAQLVKLIVAQQAYQANSQTITTEKTLIETILRA